MGKCLGSCSKRRRPPAECLTLRSGRVVPAAAATACSPRMSSRRRCRHGSGGSGCPCAKTAKRACGSPRRKSAAAARPGGRVLGSQPSAGRPEELPSSQASPGGRDVDDGCTGDGFEPNTPLSGDVVKHEHESRKGVAGQTSPSPSPPEAEVEAFFAAAELAERRRFAEAYNYDVALDRPLEGRFEWAPVST